MKKQTIKRKTVKQRIKEWVKTHPDGVFYEGELKFYPYRDDKRVTAPVTLEGWMELSEDETVEWRIMPTEPVIDDEIESHIQDKSKHLPSKGKRKKKEKNWLLEYRWISLDDFNKYPKDWFSRNDKYTEEWIDDSFNKYTSVEAAKESLKFQIRSLYQVNYIKGRYWRVRHKDTGETVEFPDIENYYK